MLPNSSTRPADIFVLGEFYMLESVEPLFDSAGWSVRGFPARFDGGPGEYTPEDISQILHELEVAKPRPAVLLTGCLNKDGPGLDLIRQCRAIEPSLKVALWSFFVENGTYLAGLLQRTPTTLDAVVIKPTWPQCPNQMLLWSVEKLLRDVGRAPGAISGEFAALPSGFVNRRYDPPSPDEPVLTLDSIRPGMLVRPVGNDLFFAFFRVTRIKRDGWISCRCIARSDGSHKPPRGPAEEFHVSILRLANTIPTAPVR